MENKTKLPRSTPSISSSTVTSDNPILQDVQPSPYYNKTVKPPNKIVAKPPWQTVDDPLEPTATKLPGQGRSIPKPPAKRQPTTNPPGQGVRNPPSESPRPPFKIQLEGQSEVRPGPLILPSQVQRLTFPVSTQKPAPLLKNSVSSSSVTAVSLKRSDKSPSQSDAETDQSLSGNSSSYYGLGVESLAPLDSLYICPVPEDLTGLHSFTNYEIRDYEGLRVFYAAELAVNCPTTFFRCLGESRPFSIKMFDTQGRAILTILRPLTCRLCVCGVDCLCHCWANETMVQTKDRIFGRVIQCVSFNRPIFEVIDEKDVHLFDILGPKWGYFSLNSLFNIHYFPICLPDSTTMVGKIRKGYDGLIEDRIQNPETIGVIFPPNCTPEDKACLLACGFMLYLTYFNEGGQTTHRLWRYTIIVLTAVFLFILAFTAVVITVNQDWD